MSKAALLPFLHIVVFLVIVGGGLLAFKYFYFFHKEQVPVLPASPRYLDVGLSTEERVANLLSYMTLEEKIGQMALVDKNSVTDMDDVSNYGLGALLSGFGAKPELNTPVGWRDMVAGFTESSRQSRLQIPILYGVDAIHGHTNVPGATVFPQAIGLGATGDAELIEKIAAATALELKATNVTWNYAPNLDLPRDIRWGRVYETFGADATLTGELGAATIKGQQSGKVLSSAKHYIGLGDMQWGSSSNKNFKIDQGYTAPDEELLRSEHLPPFKQAVDAGVESVMVGLNTWGDRKLSANHFLITEVLKGELGFKGFVVSDWYGVYEISASKYTSAVTAINAGVDMVMLPFDYKMFIKNVTKAVRRGEIAEARIDDAVNRILTAKFNAGLFEQSESPALEVIGSSVHRALARAAVAESMVLLKSEGVPVVPEGTKTIRVVGSAADNTGVQSGAWTVEWQGVKGNNVPGATSIVDGIRTRAGGSTTVEFESGGNFAKASELADVGIAVIGEASYAEGWGDLEYPVISAEDLEAVKKLQTSAKKVVVIIVSGRPLLVANEIDSWGTVIAAWLPGSEGAGVADGLFGDRPFTGKLPMSWPYTSEQLPIAADDTTLDGTKVLFPRGFGLTTQ